MGIGSAQADSSIYRITQNAYEDMFPHVSGDYVVWQGSGNGAFQIFLYDIPARQGPTQITNEPWDNLNPRTDGKHIVWWADKPSGAEIWLYDIDTGIRNQISPPLAENHYLPVIASGRVAWMQFIAGQENTKEIFLYDVSNGVQQLTDDNLDDSAPRINDTAVIWNKTDEEGMHKLFVHDFATGVTELAPEDFVWEDGPQCDGVLTVSTRYDGHDWEIAVRNKYRKGLEQITSNALDDGHPQISSSYVVWTSGIGDGAEIFLAVYTCLLPLSPGDGVTLSGSQAPTFTWQGVGYDEFRIQFSESLVFQTGNELSLPPGEENWLSGTSFIPTGEDWKAIREMASVNGRVYWKVEGKLSDGGVSYSETWSFMIDEGGVSVTDTSVGYTGRDTPAFDSGGSSCFIGAAAQ
jgi:beta propeller repeat protein